MSGEKTEKATPKKRQDERKKGHVVSSKDVSAVATLLGAAFLLKGSAQLLLGGFQSYWNRCMGYAGTMERITVENLQAITLNTLLAFAGMALPLLLGVTLVGVAAGGAQTRFLVSGAQIKPKLEHISPLAGFRRLFSMRSLVELIKALFKIGVVLLVIGSYLAGELPMLLGLFEWEPGAAAVQVLSVAFQLVLRTGGVFLAVAALDYGYQWWEHEKNMRMSKQEIKEEYKQSEGDPHIKSQIKERQRKIAMSRMMQQVGNADVVVKNPTHFAVALRYDPRKNPAPVVVAKGQDALAQRILKKAEEFDVPVVENIPLARALYAEIELGACITHPYYTVVADLFTLIYQMERQQGENIGELGMLRTDGAGLT